MPLLFELDERATAKSLATRRIVSVQCCGDFMYQKNVFSSMPNKERSFGISVVILCCRKCKHEIELQMALNRPDSESIWKFLNVSDPYAKKHYNIGSEQK